MMYSPKISEDLIPKVYRLAKAENKPMTRVVDEILRNYLNEIEIGGKQITMAEPGMKTRYHVNLED